MHDSGSGCGLFKTLTFDLPYFNQIKQITMKVQGHEHSEAYINDKIRLYFDTDSNFWQSFDYNQSEVRELFKATGNYYSQIQCWKNGHGSLDGLLHVEITIHY